MSDTSPLAPRATFRDDLPRPGPPGGTETPRPDRELLVCHDCCCGTARKHPGVDHDAQRRALLAAASPTVRVRVVDCLDVCERSNVVVVRDLTAPRRHRDTWLGGILADDAVRDIADWARRGGPVPKVLHPHVVPGPRQVRTG